MYINIRNRPSVTISIHLKNLGWFETVVEDISPKISHTHTHKERDRVHSHSKWREVSTFP